MTTTGTGEAEPARRRTGRRGPAVAAAVIGVALVAFGAASLISLAFQRTERTSPASTW